MNDAFRESPEQLKRCAFCHDQCMSATPEAVATGSQARVVSRVAILGRMLERGELEWSATSAAPLFYGLNDGWQREYCIFADEGQRIEPYLRRLRGQAIARGVAPEPIANALARTRASGNVFGLASAAPPKQPRRTGSVAYLHDQATRFLTPAVVGAAHDVLQAAGAPASDLPVESGGMVELDLGDEESARQAATAVADAIAGSGANMVVTTDPTLAYVIRFGYPFLGVDARVPVLHLTEFLVDRPVACAAGPPVKIVFHDPPWLSRGLGVIDAPREILRRMEGVQLREAASAGRLAASDGPLAGYPDPDVARAIAQQRVQELRATGAELIVTASPYSEANLAAVAGGSIAVMDVTEFLASRISHRGGR